MTDSYPRPSLGAMLTQADVDAAVAAAVAAALEKAAGSICEWCREGNIPGDEERFLQLGTKWHKIYDNWLLCHASSILAMVPDSGKALAERIAKEREIAAEVGYEQGCIDGSFAEFREKDSKFVTGALARHDAELTKKVRREAHLEGHRCDVRKTGKCTLDAPSSAPKESE